MIAFDNDYFIAIFGKKINELKCVPPFLLRNGVKLMLQIPVYYYLFNFFASYRVKYRFKPSQHIIKLKPGNKKSFPVQHFLIPYMYVRHYEHIIMQQGL